MSGEIDGKTESGTPEANFTLSNNFAVVMGDERFYRLGWGKKQFIHLICLYTKRIVRILNRLWNRKMLQLMRLYGV